jgi:septum formation protein
MVRRLARAKAIHAAERFAARLTLGADTVVLHNGIPLGKPSSLDDARRMLGTLSATTHEVLTGVCLRRHEPPFDDTWVSVTEVTFRKLTGELIEDYLQRVHVLDKAGAYAIQEHGDMLIAGISGLRSNVVGLPVEEVVKRVAASGAPS